MMSQLIRPFSRNIYIGERESEWVKERGEIIGRKKRGGGLLLLMCEIAFFSRCMLRIVWNFLLNLCWFPLHSIIIDIAPSCKPDKVNHFRIRNCVRSGGMWRKLFVLMLNGVFVDFVFACLCDFSLFFPFSMELLGLYILFQWYTVSSEVPGGWKLLPAQPSRINILAKIPYLFPLPPTEISLFLHFFPVLWWKKGQM